MGLRKQAYEPYLRLWIWAAISLIDDITLGVSSRPHAVATKSLRVRGGTMPTRERLQVR